MCGSVSFAPADDQDDRGSPSLPPTAPATDYRSGFSVIIKHNGVAATFIGGPTLQHWDLAADTPFPLNELDPDELPYVKAQAAGVVIKSLWQGL